MGNMGKTSPLRIYGPSGTKRIVSALCTIAQGIPFELIVEEWSKPQEEIALGDCQIKAFRVLHGVICYGYSITLPRKRKFDPQRARQLPIPISQWKVLQNGQSVEHEGITYTPDDVLGAPRSGLKLCYCTDTRPLPVISEMAADSDLFICEGMYGDPDMQMKALENQHMLFSEAAMLAAQAGGVKKLWLTHFSPAMPNPRHYIDQATRHFENTFVPRDGWKETLLFAENEEN